MDTCWVCGCAGSLEEHHVAGRLNNREYTVPVCSRCNNQWLKAWHYVHRVPLGKDESRTEYVSDWAMLMGTLHILEIFTRRWRMPVVPLAIRGMGRLATLAIGVLTGEEMPPPKTEKLRKKPSVRLLETSLPSDVEMLATMAAYMAAVTFGEDSVITRMFKAAARDPESFQASCESLDWAGRELRALADAIESNAGTAELKQRVDTIRALFASFAIDYLEER